jgi:hypothetical protein
MAYNRELIKRSDSGIAIPSRYNNKKKDWDIVSTEESNYASNGLYIDSLEVSFDKKPISDTVIPVTEVMVQSSKENEENIYIGNKNNQTMVLEPDMSFSIPIGDLSEVYFKKKSSVDLNLDIMARVNRL